MKTYGEQLVLKTVKSVISILYDIWVATEWNLHGCVASWVLLCKVSKGFPRQVEVAKGVPGRLRPRIFLTFRHYRGGKSSAKRTGRLYPRRNPWYSLWEAESTSGHMVLSGVPRKKSPVTPPTIDPRAVRLVAQRLNHYATPGPIIMQGRPGIIKGTTSPDMRVVTVILPRMSKLHCAKPSLRQSCHILFFLHKY